ncbi:MAG: C40 family peptidase [Bacteroidales bacterium]|nr:C40 family peptidase [Bacteroidales bacterium]
MKNIILAILILSLIMLASCATQKKLPERLFDSNQEKKSTENKNNDTLTHYCNLWLGSPYKFGGLSRKGVDCSGFVFCFYRDLYNVTLPRRSADMIFAVNVIANKDSIQTGDIVFFQDKTGNINHVGVYLENNQFIHSSTSKGVIISNLEDKYWKQHYRCAGRIK